MFAFSSALVLPMQKSSPKSPRELPWAVSPPGAGSVLLVAAWHSHMQPPPLPRPRRGVLLALAPARVLEAPGLPAALATALPRGEQGGAAQGRRWLLEVGKQAASPHHPTGCSMPADLGCRGEAAAAVEGINPALMTPSPAAPGLGPGRSSLLLAPHGQLAAPRGRGGLPASASPASRW